MDRSFSEQDAYKVLEYNRNFISRVEESFKLQSSYQNSLSMKVVELFNKGICKNECVKVFL